MKFLLDQGLPRSTAALLRDMGWDVKHVAEIGLSSATDLEIIRFSEKHEQTIITLDADFHALIVISGENRPSTIRIRIEGLKGDFLANLLLKLLPEIIDDITAGALVTVTRKAVRVHRL
ncbi:MAG: hypothetical protein A2511_04770 [Deltaproteobacteria bacterium RIFOXYD12_FULL_50_9]|nr:MAG: hypothetical protein A2511_04770 [Deltaproteobacteria bacterium RIFOXYD12_FULL_50_9]